MSEKWLPAVGYEGLYEVSSIGRVRSLDKLVYCKDGRAPRMHRGRVRKLYTHPRGHLIVTLCASDGSRKIAKVHRLVLEAFVGPNPPGLECCHNNGDPSDNRVENLRWGTHRENMRDKIKHGTNWGRFAGVEQCVNGHVFDAENTYYRPTGGRQCRTCARIRATKYREAKRGAA